MPLQHQTSFRRHDHRASSFFALPLKEVSSLSATGFVLLLLIQPSTYGQDNRPRFRGPNAPVADAQEKKSIEEKTKVHRLSSTKRSVFDAFAYVNRLPERAEKDESARDVAGRIFGRLANQEGRILLKLPLGMNRKTYLAFKTFFRYEGKAKVGNCAACHTPAEFTDSKPHVVTKGGSPTVTPSLRNLKKRKVDLRKAIMDKIAASRQKRSGEAVEIADAYAMMDIGKKDVPGLIAFLGLLNDVSDSEFRNLILNAKLLDTSKDIEGEIKEGKETRRSEYV